MCIIQSLRTYDNYSLDVYIKLFDSKVQSILQYGSEIWGLDNATQHCEKVHLYALKKYLGVSLRTPNDFVYNELNRFPITINFAIRCIKYWFKLIHMPDDRLPKKAYVMLYNLDARGKVTWATNVRNCLFRYGFGYVWMEQGVGHESEFLRLFKQRMIDCRWQNWSEHVNGSERFEMYRMFCNTFSRLPKYLCINLNRHKKYIMTKFCFGICDLATHHFRYRNCDSNNLMCQLCNLDVENEIHFLLCCPFYDTLRKKFIATKFYRNPNTFSFSMLLASNNTEIVIGLCNFLYYALKARQIALS